MGRFIATLSLVKDLTPLRMAQIIPVVRLASAEDYDAVMAISEGIYDGTDYLPVLYHIYIQRPDTKLFVAEVDGKVVAFRIVQVLDEGKSALKMGMRTLPAFQGKNIQSIMTKSSLPIIKEMYPDIECFIHTAILNDDYIKKMKKDEHFAVNRRWNIYLYKINETIIQKNVESNSKTMGNVVKLSTTQALALAEDRHIKENVIQEDRFCAGSAWLPLKKTPKNIRYLALTHQLFATPSKSIEKQWSSLSYGIALKVPYGTVYYCSFHAENTEILRDHIKSHLNHLANIVPPESDAALCLCFPKSLDGKQVIDFMHSSYGKPCVSETFTAHHEFVIAESSKP